MRIEDEVADCVKTLRNNRVLVHNITNYVTVNDCANVTLAIGASPVMADEILEVKEMVSICKALVLNIGTCNERVIASMIEAGQEANARNIPVVLDPVGVGATSFRHQSAELLMRSIRFSVIRGNMAEIKVIAGLESKRNGVDSFEDESDGARIASMLSQKLGCVIAITGKTDIVSDGARVFELNNGHLLLTKLTGTGCMSTSLIGSFLGSGALPLLSAMAGISSMSIAGEIAAMTLEHEEKLGSFKVALMDAIGSMNRTLMREKLKVNELKQ
jgi:hydroxyethylthiazole kinase